MNTKTICTICCMILLAVSVSAIGIMPAKSTLEGSGSHKFDIVNTENLDMTVYLEVEGDVASHLQLDTQEMDFTRSEGRKTLTFHYTEPASTITGWIVVRQVPKVASGQIVPSIQVKHAITLIPYTEQAAPAGQTQQAQAGSITLGSGGDAGDEGVGVLGAVGARASNFLSGVPRPEPNPVKGSELIGVIVINGLLALALVGGVRKLG